MCWHKTYYLLEIKNGQKTILRKRAWWYDVLDEDLVADACANGFKARYIEVKRRKPGFVIILP